MQLSLFPKFKRAPWQDVNGTHRQGYLKITYQELIDVLGDPHGENGDKTQAEWELQFEDGTVATLYDYKELFRVERVTDWHIGGHDQKAVDRIRELFPNHKIN